MFTFRERIRLPDNTGTAGRTRTGIVALEERRPDPLDDGSKTFLRAGRFSTGVDSPALTTQHLAELGPLGLNRTAVDRLSADCFTTELQGENGTGVGDRTLLHLFVGEGPSTRRRPRRENGSWGKIRTCG